MTLYKVKYTIVKNKVPVSKTSSYYRLNKKIKAE